MLTSNQEKVLDIFLKNPIVYAHWLGFTKLEKIHNEWIVDMVFGKDDETLQSHRGSYKTTCVSIALAIIVILFPNDKTMFNRKTDTDIKEIISQVVKILEHPATQYLVKILYGKEILFISKTADSFITNLAEADPRGTAQLLGMGIKGSVTGKHFDRIFTDDIVNKEDRKSKAEREVTKTFYMELQNVKNRGGRIFNTGTPWHEDDAFQLMPKPKVYDCYSTGLISEEELQRIKESMTASLFSANYEMKHIASDDIIFTNPNLHADKSLAEQGNCHIDASYGGSDSTAFTILARKNGKWYVFGKLWQKHVDDVLDEMIAYRKAFNAKRFSCETNADKGYLKKELRAKGELVHSYHEDTNKFFKISTYLKAVWKDVYFVEGTDDDYIKMICNYTIDADHDDAPDSLASAIREQYGKKERDQIEDGLAYLLL